MSVEFTIKRRIQFADTDMAGLIHFATYFRMMEEIEHAFFRSFGLSVAMEHEGQHIGWPRVSATCDFVGIVKFEDELDLKLKITRLGEKSLSHEVEFLLNGKQVALGKITAVCCAMENGKLRSIAIPADIREKFAGYLAGSRQ